MTPPEPRGGEGLELTTAKEVHDLIQSDDPVIRAAVHANVYGGNLINFAYALIADRKDRPSSPPSGGGGWPSREEVARAADPAAFLFEPSDLDLKHYDHARGRAFRTADAILALFPPVVGWRPIEAVEKVHGVKADLWCVDHSGGKGVRVPNATGFMHNGELVWHILEDGLHKRVYFGRPTHFQPLPAAPLTTDGVGE